MRDMTVFMTMSVLAISYTGADFFSSVIGSSLSWL